MPIIVNSPLRKRNDGSRVVRKLNSWSVQWCTLTTRSSLKLLIEPYLARVQDDGRDAAAAGRVGPVPGYRLPYQSLGGTAMPLHCSRASAAEQLFNLCRRA